MSRTLPGINIQWPWSQLLLSGDKTVETRAYPLPRKYFGVELALIETPGPRGRREARIESARIVGVITFSGSNEYLDREQWILDFKRHRVPPEDTMFRFKRGNRKFGWVVKSAVRLGKPIPAPKPRGIIFASQCKIGSELSL